MTAIFEKLDGGKRVGDSSWRMGLVLKEHHLLYGVDHGVGLWAPDGLKRAIVRVWNWIACALLGHDLLIQEVPGGPGHCVSCCRDLPVAEGLHVLKVWEDEDEDEAHEDVPNVLP